MLWNGIGGIGDIVELIGPLKDIQDVLPDELFLELEGNIKYQEVIMYVDKA